MIPFAFLFALFGAVLIGWGLISLFHMIAGMRENNARYGRLEEKVDRMQDTLETILLGDLTKAEIMEAIRRGFDANRRNAERQTVRR